MISKILLIRPPLYYIDKLGHEEPQPPLGLLYLAGALEKDYKVKILDCHMKIEQKQKIDEVYSRAGLNDLEIKNTIKSFQPNLILLSVMWVHQWSSLKSTAKLIKEINSEIKIVVGGLLPSSIPKEVCSLKDIDYVICGEGELSIQDLIIQLNKGIKNPEVAGLAYFDEGIYRYFPMKIIQNLDALPLPAYHLINFDDYKGAYLKGHIKYWPMMGILPTRGCSFKCTFCSLPNLYKNIHRYHSVERVLKEISILKNEYGVKEIHFYDANLLDDREFAVKLFNAMIENGLTIPWVPEAGLAVWSLDNEILKLAIKSGMYRLDLPIESGSSNTKQIMNKNMIVTQKIQEVIGRARENGIEKIYGYIMVGNPGEMRNDIIQSVVLLNSLDLDYKGVRFAQPYPNTEFYRICQGRGYLPKDFAYDRLWFGNPIIETEEFDRVYLNAIIAADRALALIRKKIKNKKEAIEEIFLKYGRVVGEEALKQMEELEQVYNKHGLFSDIHIRHHEFCRGNSNV